jgi:hypothetical protein
MDRLQLRGLACGVDLPDQRLWSTGGAESGGRERTEAEFRALLDAADYELTRIIPTVAPQSIIEAVPKSRIDRIDLIPSSYHLRRDYP